MVVAIDVPKAYAFAPNQRLQVASLPPIPASHFLDEQVFTASVSRASLTGPSSHSP